MEKYYYKSTLGIFEIIYEDNSVLSFKPIDKLRSSGKETPFINNIKTQLDEYFSGKRKVLDIKINPKGTQFQKKVWKELVKIPYGETKSYSEIAKMIDNPKAQRAVGNACNKNPIMIFIPCHRVISKNGNLTGFAYGIELKAKLLKLENSHS
ncbi:methylated-DNA--[bacterium]|nr:methylated-DNA--[protein]-cysteine S-methyltransferase [bacterium]